MPGQEESKTMEFQELKKEFYEVREEIKEIRDYLKGSKYTEGKGLVSQIDDHDNRIELIEKKMNKYTNIIIGLSLGCGSALPGLAKILYAFLTAK